MLWTVIQVYKTLDKHSNVSWAMSRCVCANALRTLLLLLLKIRYECSTHVTGRMLFITLREHDVIVGDKCSVSVCSGDVSC